MSHLFRAERGSPRFTDKGTEAQGGGTEPGSLAGGGGHAHSLSLFTPHDHPRTRWDENILPVLQMEKLRHTAIHRGPHGYLRS